MKGFVIYLPSQKTELAHFLAQADGCNYTPIVSVSSELVSQIGDETVFNLSKAKAILHRQITIDEIANTLSHIECWRKIAVDETIADNEFAIVAEADLQLSPNYFSTLQEYVNGYLAGSQYQLALLECSRQHEFWDDKIYQGEGRLNSALFQRIEHYNLAHCQMYLIRKSFIKQMLNKLASEKPYWLAHRLGDFCDIDNLIQTLPLIAQANHKVLPRQIKVKSVDETLDFMLQNPCSVIRFGDGEFILIKGNWIVYQDYDPKLVAELENILRMESNENRLICLPPMFDSLSPYIDSMQSYWRIHLNNHSLYYEQVCTASEYGNTFLSRPYIDWQDKTQSARWFEKLKQLWQDKDLLIVEGVTSRSGVGNDLFDNVHSIKRIICPARDAYSYIEQIQQAIIQHAENRLILLMLGPTAKVLAYNLSELGYRAIDIGHIDSEYEWFKMGATEKVRFTHKHTADFNEEGIKLENDAIYEQQIICRI